MAIADLGSRELSGAEGGLRGLRLGEGQELPRRPHTAKTHQEVRSRLSAGRESLGRTGASGKEASLLAQVRESSAQEQSDREADDFETTEGVETVGQILGYYIRKWREKEDEHQSCADWIDASAHIHLTRRPPSLPSLGTPKWR
jgi:hypothetical protein